MTRLLSQLYEFGPFRLDPVRRLLLRDDAPVQLTPKAFDTLLALVENSDRVLEKDELLRIVWPDTVVEERNLTVNISTLRKTLGEAATEHRYIVTVPGRGYRFAAAVRELQDDGSDLIAERHTRSHIVIREQQETTRGDEDARMSSTRRVPASAIALSLLFMGMTAALIYFWISDRPIQTDANAKTEVTAAPVSTPPKSIAVLPFKVIGNKKEDEYLGIGLADALITRLSSIRQIKVRPTSSVRKFADKDQELIAAGRELKVDIVLDGHVQRLGDRIRVTVQMVGTPDGASLWAGKFDERFTNIFALQDAVANQLAAAIRLNLSDEDRRLLTKRDTENPQAYQAYLKGNYFFGKRTQENFKKAIEYFKQAIAIEPNYAKAYVGLANCHMFIEPGLKTISAEALKKALEIDDTIAEAHASLAFRKYHAEWDWQGAEKGFRRAIELDPNYATAHHWYAYYLATMGRFDEALVEIKQARDLDPLSIIINTDVGEILYLARRYDEAIEVLRSAVEMDPNLYVTHYLLGYTYEQKGMYEEAIPELEKAIALFGNDSRYRRGWLGHVYALLGKKDEALKILGEIKVLAERPDATRYGPAVDLALIYAALGEKDKAFEWLEKVCEYHDYYTIHMKMDPRFDILRSDPRYPELLRRIGLAS